MDKNKIVELLNSYVQGINGKFTVKESFKDLDISVEDELLASFVNFEIPKFCIVGGSGRDGLIARTGIIQKFYTKGCELLEKNEKKYTIQVINDKYGFLYKSFSVKSLIVRNVSESGTNSYFTESEIEELKQCQGVAIDWDKAIIKEVEE